MFPDPAIALTLLVDKTAPVRDADDTAIAPRLTAAEVGRRPARSRILMVSPEHFCVQYSINPWMSSGVTVDRELARSQWDELRFQIAKHADIEIVSGHADLPDMCFSANAGLIRGNTFVPSHFRNAERKPEAALFAAWMQRRGFSVSELPPDMLFEGAGDALFDRDGRLWMGHGQRTDQRAAAALSGLLGTEVIPLALRDARFYHLDTCFCPLESGHVVFYPDAFTPQSLATLHRFVPANLRIPVSREDAMNFACNMIDLGETVIAHRASAELCETLRRAARQVITVDLGEFLKAGGGAKCLTLRLN